MKIARSSAILALMLAGTVPVLARKSESISAEEFRKLASLPMGTVRFSEYLGVSNGEACLALHEMSLLGSKSWSKTIYCTEAKGLDPAFLQALPVKQ